MSVREHQGQAGRRLYVRPTLAVYGTLRNLTTAVGITGTADGGDMVGQTKTSV